jgi:hypothetical protein
MKKIHGCLFPTTGRCWWYKKISKQKTTHPEVVLLVAMDFNLY